MCLYNLIKNWLSNDKYSNDANEEDFIYYDDKYANGYVNGYGKRFKN